MLCCTAQKYFQPCTSIFTWIDWWHLKWGICYDNSNCTMSHSIIPSQVLSTSTQISFWWGRQLWHVARACRQSAQLHFTNNRRPPIELTKKCNEATKKWPHKRVQRDLLLAAIFAFQNCSPFGSRTYFLTHSSAKYHAICQGSILLNCKHSKLPYQFTQQ